MYASLLKSNTDLTPATSDVNFKSYYKLQKATQEVTLTFNQPVRHATNLEHPNDAGPPSTQGIAYKSITNYDVRITREDKDKTTGTGYAILTGGTPVAPVKPTVELRNEVKTDFYKQMHVDLEDLNFDVATYNYYFNFNSDEDLVSFNYNQQ